MIFKMTATHLSTYFDATNIDRVQGVEFNAEVDTAEEARAIVATFPKSTKVRGGSLGTREGEKGYVSLRINLHSDGVNKGVNETGIKRYRSFLKAAEKLGHTIEYTKPYANSIATRERFEQMIGL